jgi:hypothetical protein
VTRTTLAGLVHAGLEITLEALHGAQRVAELEALVQAYGGAAAPPVLVFGDSVAERTARQDADQRPLGRMLGDELGPTLASLCISRRAFHPGVFLDFARVALAAPCPPRVVVVPINLRCFSTQWFGQPRWQYDAERAAARRAARWERRRVPRARVGPRDWSQPDAAFRAMAVEHRGSTHRTVGGFLDAIASKPDQEPARTNRLRDIFAFHYMFELGPDHARLRELKMLAEQLEGARVSSVFYLTPINHEAGARLLGASFLDALRHNVRMVRSALPAGAGSVLDLSEALPADAFFHVDEPTEHLAAAGRLEVARRLAAVIRERLGS